MMTIPALVACSSTSSPDSHSRDVVYVFSESRSIFIVDPSAGVVLAEAGPVPEQKSAPVITSDSSTLYFGASDSSGAAIYELDARSYNASRWLALAFPPNVPNDSLWITGGQLAFAPGGADMFAGDAIIEDTTPGAPPFVQRVAVIDTSTRTLKGSAGPLDSRVLSALPAGPVAANGALISLVYGLSSPGILGSLVVIDPAAHTVIDSSGVVFPASSGFDQAQSMVVAPGGRRVYLIGYFNVYAYDLVTHQLIGSVSAPSLDTHLAVSPDGNTVYLITNPEPVISQVGGSTPPPPPPATSTVIRVFDASLVEHEPIAFPPSLDSQSPALLLHDIAVSRDGASLYLQAGNRTFFPEGMLRVIVLDLATGKVAHLIPLHVWSRGVFVVGHS